jgi:hypothetical protein
LKAANLRTPDYLSAVRHNVESIVDASGHRKGTVRVCLGPGRCETLAANGEGCEWCMVFPSNEDAAYVDRFLRIHQTGH